MIAASASLCRRIRRTCLALWFVAALTGATAAEQGRVVDLELVLLIDVSSSVNEEEFTLQTRGLAQAFRSADVINGVRGNRLGVAVSVVQWSARESQAVAVDWFLLQDADDCLSLAGRLSAMGRLIKGGHTAPGDAIDFARARLDSNRFDGLRRVIDLSGDGRANDGVPLRPARDRALAAGITINGLAIRNEIPLLDHYFRERIIIGSGAFVTSAEDYADFAEAMTAKLVREIASQPLSRYRPGERQSPTGNVSSAAWSPEDRYSPRQSKPRPRT